MFDWIKNKYNKKITTEMDSCIVQNLNFVNMVEEEQYVFNKNINNDILQKIKEIKKTTEFFDKNKNPGSNFTPKETNTLLELNSYCRNIWVNYFKKKPLDFDKVFSSDELDTDK